MLKGLLRTLLRPDREELEQSDRADVAKAANILQVGEFQLLQLAYHDWFDEDLPEEMVDQLFHRYMLHDEVPHWANYYARKVLQAEQKGMVDINHPSFHRYDHNYVTHVPKGVIRFAQAALIILFVLGGGMLFSHYAADGRSASILPPYFERTTVPGERTPPNPIP